MADLPRDRFRKQRRQLWRELRRQGVRDPAVLAAMQSVHREEFVLPELRRLAYQNTPLPIGNDQTISQPLVVAVMAAALDLHADDRVLEVGTGSGYAAAVMSRIASEVYTVERYRELAETARARLGEQGFDNTHVLHGDGTLGWPEHAPYQAVVVAAGGAEVPPALLEQLDVGGRLVIPVGPSGEQRLLRIFKRDGGQLEEEDLGEVRFVPLIVVER